MYIVEGRGPTFASSYAVVPAPLVEEAILSPLDCLGTLVYHRSLISGLSILFSYVGAIRLDCYTHMGS